LTKRGKQISLRYTQCTEQRRNPPNASLSTINLYNRAFVLKFIGKKRISGKIIISNSQDMRCF